MEGEVALLPHLFKIRKLMVRLCGCFATKTIFFISPLTWQTGTTEAKEEISLVYIKHLLFFPQLFYDVTIFFKLIHVTALHQ